VIEYARGVNGIDQGRGWKAVDTLFKYHSGHDQLDCKNKKDESQMLKAKGEVDDKEINIDGIRRAGNE